MPAQVVSNAFNLIYLTQYRKQPLLASTTTPENNISSLQEMLDREIAKRGPNGFKVQQLRNQIMAEKRNQSTQQIYTSGITANHSPKADTQFIASQPLGAKEDD
jgi:hypothetical protein